MLAKIMEHPLIRHAGLAALCLAAAVALIFGFIAAVVRAERTRALYQMHFQNDVPRERLLISSLAFYLAFAIIRVITYAIHTGRGPFHDVSMGGRHIHHLVWGILLLLLVGYGWLWQVGMRSRTLGRVLAMLYGVGAALTLDEYALWLNLQDVYWERQGRASIDAALLFAGLLSIGIFGGPFFHHLVQEALHGRRAHAR
jgi:hypothetical protein